MQRWYWTVLLCLSVLLSGCTSFVDNQQPHIADYKLPLKAGDTVGQTFVAYHGGLKGVYFWVECQPQAAGELRFHLRTEPNAEEEIATVTLSLPQACGPGFQHFTFKPLRHSHGRYYYAFVDFAGEGILNIGQSSGDAYVDGALYYNHAPQDAQLAFRLAYDPVWMGIEIINAGVHILGLIGIALLLYVVPGYAVLAWVWPKAKLIWPERLVLAMGLSLAIFPLLLVWTDAVKLHLGALYAWGLVGGGIVALVWRYRDCRLDRLRELLSQWWHSTTLWPDIALLGVMLLFFSVRLLVVRTLNAPLWGDSYQHTMIAQLMVDNGGLFTSWAPYEPYRTLTMHIGFHSAVAMFMWLTGTAGIPATITAGQILNAFAALALYPLTIRVARGQRWAGVGAVAVAGLLSPMPAYYVNWGRYAQMTGQIILPIAIWLIWEVLENRKLGMKGILLSGVALAGMTLSYYRMPYYFAAFVVPWFLLWQGAHRKRDKLDWAWIFSRGILVISVTILLFLPWVGRVSGSALTVRVERGLSGPPPWEWLRTEYRIWRDLFTYVPPALVVAVVLTWILALGLRQWEPISIMLWVIALSLLVAGRLINLPGANLMQNFAVFIAFYIPVGISVGWLLGRMTSVLAAHNERLASGVMTGVLLLLSLVGVQDQLLIVDPSFIIVTRPDVRAMHWIRENTPAEARFLVEGFLVYEGRSAVGADAGWWIPFYTGRHNTMPPQYALVDEVSEPLDYSQRVVDLVNLLQHVPPSSTLGLAVLCRENVTHVYIGQGHGLVGMGVSQLFAPQDFLGHPEFELVYHQDRVHIFALADTVCDNLKP